MLSWEISEMPGETTFACYIEHWRHHHNQGLYPSKHLSWLRRSENVMKTS